MTEEGKIEENSGSEGDGSTLGSILKGLLMFVGLLIGALLITIILEMIVGLFFHLKPIWWVIPVNLLTNIIFNLLLVIFCFIFGMNYYAYVAVGEIAVIAIEYVFYKQIYKEIDPKRILIYSVVANVISAGLGLLVTSGAFL